MYAYLDSKGPKTIVLVLAFLVGVLILFFQDQAVDWFSDDLSMWMGYAGLAVMGLAWIFLRPLWGSTLEDAVNEATLAASIGILAVTVTHRHGLGSTIPAVAAVAFAYQSGKHRFFP